MTEASENEQLVRVRAQVMCRDEGTGGWLALPGGGLADVMVGRKPHAPEPGDAPGECASVRQSPPHASPGGAATAAPGASPHAPRYDYFINGRRIQDNQTVLACNIGRDFQYNKVMPTFHHWVTEHKRFGLTFQTAADARAFDKGVRTAIDDIMIDKQEARQSCEREEDSNISVTLDDGLGGSWPTLHSYHTLYPGSREEDEEQPIFECLNLPTESRSSSENSTASRVKRRPQEMTQTPILSAITLPQESKYGEGSYDEKIDDADASCPYVHLSAVHEYTYPAGAGVITSEKNSPNTKPPLMKQDSGSIKKQFSGPPPLPDKKPAETFQSRLRCKHCHEFYIESANRKGACDYAPDCFRSCINGVSCIKCAQCMLYHCMSDAEGEFAMHPCACAPPDDACTKRWIGITLLSLVVPCLCCYPPLRLLHRAARATRLAGGMHAPTHTQHK